VNNLILLKLLFLLIVVSIIAAQENNKFGVNSYPNAPYFNEFNTYIAVNEIKMWVGNNGLGSHNPQSDDSGLYWPGGMNANKTTVFADGPVFGFLRDDSARVYASTYRYGFVPGILDSSGIPINSNDSYRIFKTRQNWQSIPDPVLRAQYQKDFNEWPVEQGAPFIDNDNDGIYNPEIDEPARRGDEMLWWSNHTVDFATTLFVYGSAGDKLEIKTSVWAEQMEFPDVIYKQYLFINKGEKALEDFYFGYWSDPDVGFSMDDFAGCDSTIQMAYAYNGDNYDDDMYLSQPPAVGYLLLDGPIIHAAPNDTARFNGEKRVGYKNIDMSAFAFYTNGDTVYSDPDLGVYSGSIQMYNNLTGVNWAGLAFVNPHTNVETKFPISGDPVQQHGWYEGGGWPGGFSPGDRRILLSAGPFNLAAGDTNCATIAVMNAVGGNRIESVSKLKYLGLQIKNNWLSGQITNMGNNSNFVPEEYQLAQNYPNPFNPSTVIEFSLPEQANVQLEVFNILGEKVADLVNTEMQPGVHKVDFNGEGLASGLYIYRLTAGDVNLVRKMMLLK